MTIDFIGRFQISQIIGPFGLLNKYPENFLLPESADKIKRDGRLAGRRVFPASKMTTLNNDYVIVWSQLRSWLWWFRVFLSNFTKCNVNQGLLCWSMWFQSTDISRISPASPVDFWPRPGLPACPAQWKKPSPSIPVRDGGASHFRGIEFLGRTLLLSVHSNGACSVRLLGPTKKQAFFVESKKWQSSDRIRWTLFYFQEFLILIAC